MKIEKILALVKIAAEKMESESDRTLYEGALKSNPELCETIPCTATILAYLTHELEKDIRRASARATVRTAQLKALESVVKSAKQNTNQQPLHGTFPTKSGARAVCDGYRAVRITNPETTMPANVQTDQELFDVDKAFPSIKHQTLLELPAVSELKTMIKKARAETKNR